MEFFEFVKSLPPELRWIAVVAFAVASAYLWNRTRSKSVRDETEIERVVRENANLHLDAELGKLERRLESKLGECRQLVREEIGNVESAAALMFSRLSVLETKVGVLEKSRGGRR